MNLNFSIEQQAAKKTEASIKKEIEMNPRINGNFLFPAKTGSSAARTRFDLFPFFDRKNFNIQGLSG